MYLMSELSELGTISKSYGIVMNVGLTSSQVNETGGKAKRDERVAYGPSMPKKEIKVRQAITIGLISNNDVVERGTERSEPQKNTTTLLKSSTALMGDWMRRQVESASTAGDDERDLRTGNDGRAAKCSASNRRAVAYARRMVEYFGRIDPCFCSNERDCLRHMLQLSTETEKLFAMSGPANEMETRKIL